MIQISRCQILSYLLAFDIGIRFGAKSENVIITNNMKKSNFFLIIDIFDK